MHCSAGRMKDPSVFCWNNSGSREGTPGDRQHITMLHYIGSWPFWMQEHLEEA